MDKNQIIGIVLIVVIWVGYFLFFRKEPDLISDKNLVELVDSTKTKQVLSEVAFVDSSDTNKAVFIPSVKEEFVVVNTPKFQVKFSTKGGQPVEVNLKEYEDFHYDSLVLFDQESMSLKLKTSGDKPTVYSDLIYSPSKPSLLVTDSVNNKISFTSQLPNGGSVVHTYTFLPDSYVIEYNLSVNDPSQANGKLMSVWTGKFKRLEKSISESVNNSTINYYTIADGFDDVGASNEDEKIEDPITWFSVKHRFFNIGLINKGNSFAKADFETKVLDKDLDTSYIKEYSANVEIAQLSNGVYNGALRYYFGPNDLDVINDGISEGYKDNVYLGWPIFSVINKWLVIPIFNVLEKFISNYGLIILILVLVIKLLLFPIAYRSYLSMAKMRELKPELDEIKARIGDDSTKVQQESMKLYSQVGVNPISGCIPMVLQMPILFALFRFFPNAIHLRHESFLWATDLSTYDDVISWSGNIPLLGSVIGNHISIFCLLMTLSTIAYTYYNNQINVSANNQMKIMSYMMPLVFFFVLNNYSSGLTFYYFVSNIITIAQQNLATRFIDKDKIRVMMEENKKKNASGKKSGFQKRMEDAMKATQERNKKK